MEWHPVHRLSQDQAAEAEAAIIPVKGGKKNLCLVRHAGKWHALAAKCPHAGGPLAAGFVNETGKIVCPWHRFAFDLESGHSDSGGYVVKTYQVKEEDGKLWVGIPKKKGWFW